MICYFSAGSAESWRDDYDAFPAETLGEPLDNWPNERWVDVRAEAVRTIMLARLDLGVAKDCDGVEPDNVDGWENDTGLPLTREDQLDYDRFLADAAHARGLSIGLKNAVDLVRSLEPHFDWALNEECLDYDECERLRPFLQAGKAVFHVEYANEGADGPARAAEVCGRPEIAGFSTLIKRKRLGAWRLACEP